MRVASTDATPVFFSALTADSTAANALNLVWDSFNRGCDLFVEYAPEGVRNGNVVMAGRALVSDMSLTASLDAVPEFSLNLEGSGQLVTTDYGTGSGEITIAGVPTP